MSDSFTYRVVRSDRKSIAITISREQEVIVRVPKKTANKEITKIVEAHRDWIETHLEKAKLSAAAHPEPTEEERRRYIEYARTYLPKRIEYFGSLMGLKPSGLTITGAVTRYGSCSPKNRLCFSWRLMRYPDDIIDCVVVHELAHIKHKNHGKDFYALINSIMPDYAQRKKQLKGI